MATKKKSGIHIKPSHKGRLTSWCGGKVTAACIQRGLHSKNASVRRMANFARNASKWHHGGPKRNPKYYKAAGGSIGGKKKWIQHAINPAHKGYCTPMTKSTCTPRRKALAKRLKAMAKSRKG